MSTSPATLTTATRPRLSQVKRWVFRCAAVLIGLSPFLGFEVFCHLCGWGRPSLHDDPFVGFQSVRPLFVLNEDGSRYEIPKSRQVYFRPESFAAKKPAGEFRIFCLGGSTVQGRPFAIETSFTTWLEISLNAGDNSRTWNVVNCGGVSYASYRLVPILQEVLNHEPDLILVYTGHNEFLESRSFEHITERGRFVNASLGMVSQSRTFTLAREAFLNLRGRASDSPPEERPILPAEVDALLDYRGGLERYHWDTDWRQGVIDQYAFNLRRMVELTRQAGVPVILANPASNFGDSPPFKAEHAPDLSAEKRSQWKESCREAATYFAPDRYDLRKATACYERACQIDPLHADAFYNLGKCYEAIGDWNRAREAFQTAKDCDVCPLRILKPMNDVVLDIAGETGTPLVDAQRLFDEQSRGGIVGEKWLIDHVHPTIHGHQLLADSLAEKLVSLKIMSPSPQWEKKKAERFQEHADSLEPLYFLKGMQRLEGLRRWAAGRVERLRPSGSK